MIALRPATALLLSLTLTGCAIEADDHEDHDHVVESEDDIASVQSALSATDPVSAAISSVCSTTAVRGLSEQLIAEVECMRPNTFDRIDNIPRVTLGAAVFPFMQKGAAQALEEAVGKRDATLTINSAYRTLPQQFLLYSWYQQRRCGISLAAKPGRSNHESAIAVDIADNAAWRSTMNSVGYKWIGSSDPVHFDRPAGAIDIRPLSVKAFQRLWNRNNPNDRIAEDGAYGPATEARLRKAPVGGFAIGASCEAPPDDTPLPEEEPESGETDQGAVPGGLDLGSFDRDHDSLPGELGGSTPNSSNEEVGASELPGNDRLPEIAAADAGCSASGQRADAGLWMLGLGLVLGGLSRRRR